VAIHRQSNMNSLCLMNKIMPKSQRSVSTPLSKVSIKQELVNLNNSGLIQDSKLFCPDEIRETASFSSKEEDIHQN
jgi:hypothetical protein